MQITSLVLRNEAAGPGGMVVRMIGVGILLLSLLLVTGKAWAISEVGDPPIYNPASKSYFQLLKGTGKHGNWPEALRQASAKRYRDVQGRLAVIDRPETHQFVMENFDTSKEMWIGLRYWCRYRMLEWVGLRPYSPSDPDSFQHWHPQWSRGDQGCIANSTGSENFMGVYYRPLGKGSARWQAVRKGKGFGRLLVEFPTGEE